jgi:hypothetical protein
MTGARTRANRETVDLSAYPDLVVIHLGMQARSLRGLLTLLRFGPRIQRAADARPDGLLKHETLVFGFFPPHFGIRQYLKDFASLEEWTRSAPHGDWWRAYLRDTGGTGFWHETFLLRGGAEAVYIDIDSPVGLRAFAPTRPARGSLFSARRRLPEAAEPALPPPLSEGDLYR